MTSRPFAATTACLLVTVALVLSACSSTVDPAVTTIAADRTTTTTFVVAGSTSALLDQLVAEATPLSEAIVENERDDAVLARVVALWDAARPGVESAAPALLLEFDRAIEMMRTAVERRRHADADKALNNLRFLVAALPPLA